MTSIQHFAEVGILTVCLVLLRGGSSLSFGKQPAEVGDLAWLEVATMDLKIAHTHMHTCISRNVGSALALEQDWEVWRQYT